MTLCSGEGPAGVETRGRLFPRQTNFSPDKHKTKLNYANFAGDYLAIKRNLNVSDKDSGCSRHERPVIVSRFRVIGWSNLRQLSTCCTPKSYQYLDIGLLFGAAASHTLEHLRSSGLAPRRSGIFCFSHAMSVDTHHSSAFKFLHQLHCFSRMCLVSGLQRYQSQVSS
jgi:hypothetical protein